MCSLNGTNYPLNEDCYLTVVMLCSLIEVYWHFRRPCCHHYHNRWMTFYRDVEAAGSDETLVHFYQTTWPTTQKTSIFR